MRIDLGSRLLVSVLWLASCTASRGAGSPPDVFQFVQVTDIHVRDELTAEYPRKVVAAMNTERATLALMCGDVATDGLEAELRLGKHVLDKLKIPYHVVVGNHDSLFYGDRDETLFTSVFEQRETTYSFERDGIHFVAIDPGTGKNYHENAVRPSMLARLRSIAARIPNDAPVILFSHYPYGPGVRYRTQNADEVLEIFRRKRLLAVISGHFHGNSDIRVNGVLFTTTAAASSTRRNHDKTRAKGYRLFTVRHGRTIETTFREVPP